MFRGRSASQLNVEKSQIKNQKIHNSYESESSLTPRNNNRKGFDLNNNYFQKTDENTSIVK